MARIHQRHSIASRSRQKRLIVRALPIPTADTSRFARGKVESLVSLLIDSSVYINLNDKFH